MMKKLLFILSFIFFFSFGVKASAATLNYGISKTSDGVRPYPGKTAHDLITNHKGLYIGPDEKNIYLTFDCGYENGFTEGILDVLKEEQVPAIFFITGHYLTSATPIVKRMIDEGHLIGNHSNRHKNFAKISGDEMLTELTSLSTMFQDTFDLEMTNFIRPPEGAISSSNAKVLADNGYFSLYWSLAYVDWYKDRYYGNHFSYNNVIPRLHNGAIILMHTVGKDNMVDLKDIIVTTKEKGYTFSSVNELI